VISAELKKEMGAIYLRFSILRLMVKNNKITTKINKKG
jgi:hypothetical protein